MKNEQNTDLTTLHEFGNGLYQLCSGDLKSGVKSLIETGVQIVIKNFNQYYSTNGKSPNVSIGMEKFLYLAEKAAVAQGVMRDIWQKLLITACDPDHSIEIRSEDIRLIESLHPSDCFLIVGRHLAEQESGANTLWLRSVEYKKIQHFYENNSAAFTDDRQYLSRGLSLRYLIESVTNHLRVTSRIGLMESELDYALITMSDKHVEKNSNALFENVRSQPRYIASWRKQLELKIKEETNAGNRRAIEQHLESFNACMLGIPDFHFVEYSLTLRSKRVLYLVGEDESPLGNY